MPRGMKPVAALLLPFLAQAALAGPLVLDFQVQRQTVPAKTPHARPETVNMPLHVVLDNEVIHLQEDKDVTHYDFRTRLINRNTDQVSLYSVPAYRSAELANRILIGAALTHAKVKASADMTDGVLLEQLFSLHHPKVKQHPKIAPGAALQVTHKKQPLLSGSAAGEPLDADTARLYVRFLRFYACGHPEALAELQRRQRVPRQLTFTLYSMDKVTRLTLTLQKLEHRSEPVTVPQPVASNPLDQLLARTLTLTDQADHDRQVNTQASLTLAQKNYFSAMLLFLSSSLSTQQPLPAEVSQNKAAFGADADTRSLLAHITGHGEADSQALAALEPRAGGGLHVLQIFEAGILRDRGQLGPASLLLQQALEKDPYVTNAWNDLGAIFYLSYEMESAWKSWTAGRHLNPLPQVDQLESELRRDCPAYF